MTARTRGVVALTAVVITIVVSAAGLWLRAAIGPLWPSVLTDWTLGAALLAISGVVVGAVLLSRVPGNVVGWLFLALGPGTAVVLTLRQATTLWLTRSPVPEPALWTAWGFAWVIPLNMMVLSLLLTLFPHGSPPSRRWRPIVAVIVVAGLVSALATMISPYLPTMTPFAALPNPAAAIPQDVGALLVDGTGIALQLSLIAAVAAAVVRGRRARGVERQQMKWFVYAAVVAVVTFLVGFWVPPLFTIATLVAFPALPVAAGIAVLRYRLYDIDRVINRTVVYAIVTGVLAAAYVAAVAATRPLMAAFTGDTAPSVAASTLAIAALFRPVRTRVQAVVDRRFNRARYDAAATVDNLRLRLRDELDLDALQSELLAAVYVTMEPAGTALWLRESG